ncbi:MAG TPA: hypothetical protein VMQ46_05790 [Acidimicrobiia bacterium]|nr:hypothetical protein [Acidimicrobiia bacterium]
MSSFDGRLGLPGQPRLPFRVEIDVSGASMTLTAGGTWVADWRLDEAAIARHADGFHVTADDEELIISVADPTQFALELGISEQPTDRAPSSAA